MTKATTSKTEPHRKMPPARTPEARENQMISLAIELAEKQLMEGTASSQVITHFLKLGSTKEKIDNLGPCSYLRILAYNKNGQAYLNELKKKVTIA